MNEQINEPFNPEIKSSKCPLGIHFRLARMEDASSITDLMFLRNPEFDFEKLAQQTTREIFFNNDERLYKVFVAELNQEILGFCRFYHSQEVSKEKQLFDSPEAFYCMGTIVKPDYRRNNIAKFLSEGRFLEIQKLGGSCAYSGVSGCNETSIKMHESFGYKRISEIDGFLQVKFDCGYGYLYKKELTN